MVKKRIIILCATLILIIITACIVNRPEISEEALTGSAELMEGNQEIEEAEIILEENKLKFYMVPTEDMEVSQERLRELGADFLRFLGGYVANEELLGPSEESYGGIYDFYDAEIIVEGFREVLDKGTMKKASNKIIWE